MSTTYLPGRLFKEGDEPNGERVHEYGNLSIIEDIRASLPQDELQILADSQFGKLLDIPADAAYSGKLIHFLLTRQLVVKKKHEIWFIFGGSPIRFSISEFKAVTGLTCSKLPTNKKKRPGKRKVMGSKYWFTVFDRADISVEWVVNRLKKRLVGDKETRLRFALLALVDGVLCPTSGQCKISSEHVDMSENLEKFLLHPWGTAAFDMTLQSIQARGAAKLKKKSITVQGFPHALQLVLLQSVPVIKELHFTVEAGDEDSEMEVEEPEIGRLWTLKLDIVWKVDGKSGCSVTPCIGDLPDGTVGECTSWSDDEEDDGVQKIHQMIVEKKEFTSSMFVGGIVSDDVADAVNGNSDNGSNDCQTQGKKSCHQSNPSRTPEANDGGGQRFLTGANKKYIDMKLKGSEKRLLKAVAESEERLRNIIERKWGQPYPGSSCANKSASQSCPHCDPNRSLPEGGTNPCARAVKQTGRGIEVTLDGTSSLGTTLTHSVLPADNARSASTSNSPTWHSALKKRKANPRAPSIGAIVSDQTPSDVGGSSVQVPAPLERNSSEDTDAVAPTSIPSSVPEAPYLVDCISNSATMGVVPPTETEGSPAPSTDATRLLHSNHGLDIPGEGHMAEGSGPRISKEELSSQPDPQLIQPTNSAIGDSYADPEAPYVVDFISNSATMGVVPPTETEGSPAPSTDATRVLHSNHGLHIPGEGHMAEGAGPRITKEERSSQPDPQQIQPTNSAIGDSYADPEGQLPFHGDTHNAQKVNMESSNAVTEAVPQLVGVQVNSTTPHAVSAILPSQTSEEDRNILGKIIRITSQEGNIKFGNSLYLTSAQICEIIDLKSFISPQVMDIIFNSIRRSWESSPQIEQQSKITFRDSAFVESLCSHYPKFSKSGEKGMYCFDEELLTCCPIGMDKVYVPFHFDKRHWVCLCVDLQEWNISVIDSYPASWREAKIKTFVQPFAEMFPHLVRFATTKVGKKKVFYKPMVVQREKDIPHACSLTQSGVMSAYLSEVHAKSGVLACKLVTVPEVFHAAMKYVVAAYEAVNGAA